MDMLIDLLVELAIGYFVAAFMLVTGVLTINAFIAPPKELVELVFNKPEEEEDKENDKEDESNENE